VIRQAISCDICGTEKKQTNHWFVAYDQGGELRVSGWNTRNRLRPGSKHLCGQTCLHKLVDEFMARSLSVRAHPVEAAELEVEEQMPATNASLTSGAAYVDAQSSAHLLKQPVADPAALRPLLKSAAELVAVPPRPLPRDPVDRPDEPPLYMSRQWRAEAWERERERELRAVDRRPEIALRRRSN
jgi:hypothetical protein